MDAHKLHATNVRHLARTAAMMRILKDSRPPKALQCKPTHDRPSICSAAVQTRRWPHAAACEKWPACLHLGLVSAGTIYAAQLWEFLPQAAAGLLPVRSTASGGQL